MKPKPSRPREVERVVLGLGFVFLKSKGSHKVYRHPSGRITGISFHPGDVPMETLRGIIGEMGISIKQFNDIV